MRVVFLGSGPFGLPALERLSRSSPRHEVVRVLTRPDRPQKRGQALAPMPVRVLAGELGLPCDAPDSANGPACLESLRALAPDIFIVADYGEMLRKLLREIPRIGVFNLHASILPRYRGAAPIVHALLQGEQETGVTLFRIEKGLDSGPIVDVESTLVKPLETASELEERLARVAADLLERNLDAFAAGTFTEKPQDETLATLAPRIEKRAGEIRWEGTAERVANLVHAMNPWPGAYSFLHPAGGRPERTIFLRVRPAHGAPDPGSSGRAAPGTVERIQKDGFAVRCGVGSVDVLEVQREGKSALAAGAYLRGRQLTSGDVFQPEAAA